MSKIKAVDARYTGEEPIWDDWQNWSPEKYWKEYTRSFTFYNYYCNAKDTKPAVIEWMQSHGYTKEEIRAIKSAPDYSPGTTTGTLCTCMNRGMPPLHPNLQGYVDSLNPLHGPIRSDEVFVREQIAAAIANSIRLNPSNDLPTTNTTVAISPMVRLQKKCLSTMIMDLDLLMDEWCKSGDVVRIIPVFSAMKDHGLPAASCSQVESYLAKIHTEMSAALLGADPYFVENYSYLTKKQLTARVEALASMINDLGKFKNSAKAARAPREKKPTSTAKQIAKIQYMKHSEEFKITSINPVRIVGAQRLLAFNTKTRMLFDYKSAVAAGLAIKGTTLQNLDEATCRCIRLRKPEEFLQIALNSTANQFEKAWTKLTTKEGKPNGRINSDTILLRAI